MSHAQEVVGHVPERMQQLVSQVGMWNLPVGSSVT